MAPLIISCLFILGFIFCLVAWIGEIIFYKAQNWDFTVSSGRKLYGGTGTKELSNRTRVVFGFPILGLMWLVLGIFFFTVIKY